MTTRKPEMLSISIILPCLNEANSISHIYSSISSTFFGLTNYSVQVLFVDDGSTDETWEEIRKLVDADQIIPVLGIKLPHHVGKAHAQAVGIRYAARSDSVIVVMDSDGQHDPKLIPEMLELSIEKNLILMVERTGYQRRPLSYLGTKGLQIVTKILDLNFNPKLAEFLVIPHDLGLQLSRNSQLGLLPIVPIIETSTSRYSVFPANITSRSDGKVDSRWGAAQLWHKAILHVLVDPWKLLPRLALAVAVTFTFVGLYAFIVGVISIAQGQFLGIGSVIISLVLVFLILASTQIITLGLIVLIIKKTEVAPFPTAQEMELQIIPSNWDYKQ